jgi:hypothetical protein
VSGEQRRVAERHEAAEAAAEDHRLAQPERVAQPPQVISPGPHVSELRAAVIAAAVAPQVQAGAAVDGLFSPARPGSVRAGEPDDRQGTVGRALVADEARNRLGNPLPRVRAGIPLKLGRGDPQLTAAELDPDLVGVRG